MRVSWPRPEEVVKNCGVLKKKKSLDPVLPDDRNRDALRTRTAAELAARSAAELTAGLHSWLPVVGTWAACSPPIFGRVVVRAMPRQKQAALTLRRKRPYFVSHDTTRRACDQSRSAICVSWSSIISSVNFLNIGLALVQMPTSISFALRSICRTS